MHYFTSEDHQRLACHNPGSAQSDYDIQLVYDKFFELHTALYGRLRDLNYDLHSGAHGVPPVSSYSLVGANASETLALIYARSREQALLVERMMGRERNHAHTQVELGRHPAIELRLTPDHFVIELIVSPDAWWDQQNLIGKLGIQRHRDSFRSLLQRMEGDFRLGFWSGEDLSDMHLTTRQLVRGNYLNEWMSTFADGQDWLRMGMWYAPEAPELETSHILRELVTRVGGLYSVYDFLLWTSNNDFHPFYQKLAVGASSARFS